MREVLATLWPGGAQPELFDLAEVGVRLRSPTGAPLAIRMELRGILADHVALAAGLCLKGHSGTKFCHLCQNAVEAEVAGGSGEWLARASGSNSWETMRRSPSCPFNFARDPGPSAWMLPAMLRLFPRGRLRYASEPGPRAPFAHVSPRCGC